VHDKTVLLKNLHINIIHGYDEDTVLRFKYRKKLGFSPVSFDTSGHVIGEAGKKKPLSWRGKTACTVECLHNENELQTGSPNKH
jgi:hypothetical protein